MIVILNGPPGIGKDTLADMIVEKGQGLWKKLNFKDELYEDTAWHYGLETYLVKDVATDRDTKEVPSVLFGGKTPREALIHVSETLMKPRHGNDYYGQALASTISQHMHDGIEHFIIADGGFEEEINPIVDDFNNVHIIHMLEDGYDFEGDSRNYIESFPEITDYLWTTRGDPEADYGKFVMLLSFFEEENDFSDNEPDDTPFLTEEDPEEGERL